MACSEVEVLQSSAIWWFTLIACGKSPGKAPGKANMIGCTSLVPRPRPAFRRLQYGKAFTVLIATESWAGPGNEAMVALDNKVM